MKMVLGSCSLGISGESCNFKFYDVIIHVYTVGYIFDCIFMNHKLSIRDTFPICREICPKSSIKITLLRN